MTSDTTIHFSFKTKHNPCPNTMFARPYNRSSQELFAVVLSCAAKWRRVNFFFSSEADREISHRCCQKVASARTPYRVYMTKYSFIICGCPELQHSLFLWPERCAQLFVFHLFKQSVHWHQVRSALHDSAALEIVLVSWIAYEVIMH